MVFHDMLGMWVEEFWGYAFSATVSGGGIESLARMPRKIRRAG
ncbi:hypothetical protein [Mesorhizobium sp.]|nr:hypothetical protein [Mesorhizobium sp.]